MDEKFYCRDWSPKFETGLNVIISIDQKIYDWPGCSLAKMMMGIILAKEQLGHSYAFWTMPINIISPVKNFGDQSLCAKLAPSNCGHANAYFLEKMAQLMTVAVNYRWVAKNPSLASGSDIIVDADSLFSFHLHTSFRVQLFHCTTYSWSKEIYHKVENSSTY